MSVAGNWTLTITDNAHSDYGALDGWSLDFLTAVPYVTVTATIPDATEAPMVPGQFTVTRAVITAQPLTVNLLFEGTAANGIDYQPVLYTVIIPAYQASQTIAISPILQPQWKGARTVIATVTSGSGYVVGTAGGSTSATVTIADGPGKRGIPLLGPWQMVLMALLLAGTGVMTKIGVGVRSGCGRRRGLIHSSGMVRYGSSAARAVAQCFCSCRHEW